MNATLEAKRMTVRRTTQPLVKRSVPPLENGDNLTQKEFHRRYLAMPDVRAELINGVVFMTAAATNKHSEPLSLGTGWLLNYEASTPGVRTRCEQTLVLDSNAEVQPDASLGILPECGGSGVLKNGYLVQAPELLFEIANTSASIDLNVKFESYRRNNAQEYLIHLAREKAVKWFALRDGKYELLMPENGVIRSVVFPGLWLNVKALVKRDLPALFRTLNEGLATPEHAAFCARLREASKKSPTRKKR
jgi:Uma2 family endonuclease